MEGLNLHLIKKNMLKEDFTNYEPNYPTINLMEKGYFILPDELD